MLARHGAGRRQRGAARGPGARGQKHGRRHRRPRPRCARRPGLPGSGSGVPAPVSSEPSSSSPLPSSGSSPSSRSCPASATAPRSGSRFTSCAPPTRTRSALAEAIREVKERIGLCEVCFNLADEPRCRICQDTRRDHERDLRRGGAQRRDPDGAHPRVPRRLPRARRGALADRRRRPRGPADRRALRARGSARSRRRAAAAVASEVVLATNPTTTGEATALHIAEELRERAPSSRSRAWPAACRSARTSSTPTRSRSARRSRAPLAVAQRVRALGGPAHARRDAPCACPPGAAPSATRQRVAGAASPRPPMPACDGALSCACPTSS